MKDKKTRKMLELLAKKLGLDLDYDFEKVYYYGFAATSKGILQQLEEDISKKKDKENLKTKNVSEDAQYLFKIILDFARSYHSMQEFPLSNLAFYKCELAGIKMKNEIIKIMKNKRKK